MPDGDLRLVDLHPREPSRETLRARYTAIDALLDGDDRPAALAAWDALRREHAEWAVLAQIRFFQDTESADAIRSRALADSLDPVVKGFDTAIKARLLDEDRASLLRLVGPHVVALWETDRGTFTEAVADRLEEEQALAARYTAVTAAARITVEGETVNLSGLDPFSESLDRGVRHRAARAKWGFFAAASAELDDVFDRMVSIRTGIARALGDRDFVALAYRRMRRLDYGPDDVARYRDEIVSHVVPLLSALVEKRRGEEGWERFHAWDWPLLDPLGNPKPVGTPETLLDAGATMFARMDDRIAALYGRMREGGFLDLLNRPTKAPGGFCEAFPVAGVPFIFANFNGTHHDIDVLTHEMGHAIQAHESRALPTIDTLSPTMEAAEINSMALELLTAPHAELLVGESAADRYRRGQLVTFLGLMAQCALGDHFQHEVYAHPELSAAERHAVWRRLERRYAPWTDWGDVAYPATGGAWQATLHFFLVPFYLIDYALAASCALQFWAGARNDRTGALERYMALAARGGSAPFGALVREAGLRSPFEPGVLAGLVRDVERALAT